MASKKCMNPDRSFYALQKEKTSQDQAKKEKRQRYHEAINMK